MARPTKNNCDYFPHDGNMRNHRKVKAIITRFKLEGYAHWCMLLEVLTRSDNFTLIISDEIEWELLASDLHTTSEKLKEFINYLITLSLIQNEGDHYWSDNLMDNFKTLLNKRVRSREAFEEAKKVEKIIGKKIQSSNGINRALRVEVYQKFDFKCVCCGNNDPLVLDVHHVIPRHKGGSDNIENLSLLCANCHRKEHNCLDSVAETIFSDNGNSQSKVKESKVKESIQDILPSNFALSKIFAKKYSDLQKHFKTLTPEGFEQWKLFVDFIIQNNFTEIFDCKFVNPPDFQKLVYDKGFTEDKWEKVLQKLLSTGVRPEHNLFFRIPDFMEYAEKGKGKAATAEHSQHGRSFKKD